MRRTLMVCVVTMAAFAPAAMAADDAKPAPAEAKEVRRFRTTCAELAEKALANKEFSVAGEDGWWFLWSELRHLGAGEFWGEKAAEAAADRVKAKHADPLPVIVDVREQLKQRGIDLLLVPVPPKAVIYPDKLAEGFAPDRPLDAAHQGFYKRLRAKGVKVLDLTGPMRRARADEDSPKVYCKTDAHFSPYAVALTAKAIREQIGEADWLGEVEKHEYVTDEREMTIVGDLTRNAPEDRPNRKETLQYAVVGSGQGDSLEYVQPDRSSPVLLMGDSHTLVFHLGGDLHARGAGLPDHLAKELGFPVDLLGKRGSGATPTRADLYRRSAADPDYLDGKKLVIWCLTAREFTEEPWMKFPVAPKKK